VTTHLNSPFKSVDFGQLSGCEDICLILLDNFSMNLSLTFLLQFSKRYSLSSKSFDSASSDKKLSLRNFL